nr:uncharacterized protein LOC101253948 [Solanum lycopersicum]
MVSSLFIGTSFTLKKKSLMRAAVGTRAGTGYIQCCNCFSNIFCNVHHFDHHRKHNNVQGLDWARCSSIVSDICGFITVLSGIILLHLTREQEPTNPPRKN